MGELLDRMSSQEITEWHVFFEMQDAELKRSRRSSERGSSAKPSIGDATGRADAIQAARDAQGLA